MKPRFPMQTNPVSGSFFMWLAIFAGLAALLFWPVGVCASAALTLSGGEGAVTLRLFGVPATVYVRLRLLEKPPLSVDLLRRDGTVRAHFSFGKRRKPTALSGAATRAIRVQEIRAEWLIGVPDEPALTEWLCGAASTLTRETLFLLLPKARTRAVAAPVFSAGVCRLGLTCIARVKIADIIKEICMKQGE